MATKGPPLNVLLKHFDTNNMEIWETFRHNETDRKELERNLAYMLPLWMSGCANARDQINTTMAFNKHINLDWKQLDGHPELRAKVLAAIGLGKQVRHDFMMRSVRGKLTSLGELLLRRYPDIRQDEILLWCRVNTEPALIELCRDYGLQSKEQEAVLNEYRKCL